MIWVYLGGFLLFIVAGISVWMMAGSPMVWVKLIGAALADMAKYIAFHGRPMTPEEVARLREGQWPYKASDRDHTHEDHH